MDISNIIRVLTTAHLAIGAQGAKAVELKRAGDKVESIRAMASAVQTANDAILIALTMLGVTDADYDAAEQAMQGNRVN